MPLKNILGTGSSEERVKLRPNPELFKSRIRIQTLLKVGSGSIKTVSESTTLRSTLQNAITPVPVLVRSNNLPLTPNKNYMLE
jgi:hypothetical protein